MFKFLLKIFLSVMVFTVLYSNTVYAETVKLSDQIITLDKNNAVIAVQKQPLTDTSKQGVEAKRNWFCIIIQVNGKVLNDKANN